MRFAAVTSAIQYQSAGKVPLANKVVLRCHAHGFVVLPNRMAKPLDASSTARTTKLTRREVRIADCGSSEKSYYGWPQTGPLRFSKDCYRLAMHKWKKRCLKLLLSILYTISLAMPAHADLRTVSVNNAFAELVQLIYDAEPPITHLQLLPFKAISGGAGDCDTELRNAVADSMGKRQADTLSSRRIELRHGSRSISEIAGHATVVGTYGITDRQIWAEVIVQGPSGVVVVAMPRRILSDLVCKGHTVSLLQAVEARTGAGPDTRLSIKLRNEARIGDVVTFDIISAVTEPTLPLCLNISSYGTAQVLTPLRPRSPALKARDILNWPSDFASAGLSGGPYCHEREQSDAIVCFAMRNAPNPALARLWAAAWPENTREPREIAMDEALDLISAAVETSAAVAAERYRVGPAIAGVPSACRRVR